VKKELLKGFVDIYILIILKKGSNYGYGINKCIKVVSEGSCEINEATLYIALKRLESKKFIKSYYENTKFNTKRKYYSLTDDGKGELKNNICDFENINKLIKNLMEVKNEQI